MDIASIIEAVLAPGEDRPGRGLTDWQPGDRLVGRVLQVENDGRVLMDLGGSRALARVGFCVRAGQTLPLQVVENGTVFHLQVVSASTDSREAVPLPKADFQNVLQPPDQERLVGMVRQLINPSAVTASPKTELPEVVKSALTRILTLFEPIPVDETVPKISQWIKGAVEDRGLLLEKKLDDAVKMSTNLPLAGEEKDRPPSPARIIITRDVKSQLLVVRQLLASSDAPTPLTEKLNAESAAFLRHAVVRLLEHIETRQEQAVARWADGETQQIFIHALPLQDQKTPVQLKIYYPKKERRSQGNGQHRIALLLDMDRLGPVRVDLAMLGQMLQITFYVAHQKALGLIEPEVKSVSGALSGYFEHVAIDLYISRQKILNFEKEDTHRTGGGSIDLTV
ncbi:MAG: flagellar hook-length control protein FliK [Desulfobacteraceae bacterium]